MVPWILPFLPITRVQQVRKGFETIDRESRAILAQKRLDLKNGGIDGVGGGKDLISILRTFRIANNSMIYLLTIFPLSFSQS